MSHFVSFVRFEARDKRRKKINLNSLTLTSGTRRV